MGMFDYVVYEAPCWNCGTTIKDWQSKDGPCGLLILDPKDVNTFYEFCDCGAWNEFTRKEPVPLPEFEHNKRAERRDDVSRLKFGPLQHKEKQ